MSTKDTGLSEDVAAVGTQADGVRSLRDEAPFAEGDIVRIKGSPHLSLHRIDTCEWFEHTNPGVPHYWLCQTSEIREPIDWARIPPGATGIVTACGWAGSAHYLERAEQ